MEFTSWLDSEKGRGAWLAAHFGVTPSAISQWKTNGVPLACMKEVQSLSGDAVSLEEMVPGKRTAPTREAA